MTPAAHGAGPSVSVVIPSWRRPALLRRTLLDLAGQTHPGFQVIVVGDAEDAAACGAPHHLAGRIVYIRADAPNISRSRNLGLARASGEIVAFLDDDASPSPFWLKRLAAPFVHDGVGAVGGRLLDPGGLSDEGALRLADFEARDQSLTVDERAESAPAAAPEGWFPTVIGANCAFRRAALAEVGGFDEAFAYFLDETELCARLHLADWGIAPAPSAEVVHWRAPGSHRKANGAPRSLYEIGASVAAFAAAYAGPARAAQAVAGFRAARSARLERMRLQGRVTIDEAREALRGFDAGAADGARRGRRIPSVALAPPANPAPGALWRANGAPRAAVIAPMLGASGAHRLSLRLAEAGADASLVTMAPARRLIAPEVRDDLWTFACGPRRGGFAGDLMRICAFRGVEMTARPLRRALGRATTGAIRLEGAGEGFVLEALDPSDAGAAARMRELADRLARAP